MVKKEEIGVAKTITTIKRMAGVEKISMKLHLIMFHSSFNESKQPFK